MKKILITLFAMMTLFSLTACGEKENLANTSKNENNTSQNETQKSNENENTQNNGYIDDEIIDIDDEDNNYYKEDDRVVVERVINCDGCVYAYFSGEGDQAKRLGDTLSDNEYTTDINNIRTAGNKQRHNFFGLVLDGKRISKAYACILKDNKIYCIQGSTDGAYFSNNIGVLNQVFAGNDCRYISDGHTYTCSDGSYNGDTKTSGYTGMHYETSCTIYGADAKTGQLICH